MKPADDVDLPVNDLLLWRIIRDEAERCANVLDMVGTDDSRVSRYKANFAPQLKTFYSGEVGNALVTRLVALYRRIP